MDEVLAIHLEGRHVVTNVFLCIRDLALMLAMISPIAFCAFSGSDETYSLMDVNFMRSSN